MTETPDSGNRDEPPAQHQPPGPPAGQVPPSYPPQGYPPPAGFGPPDNGLPPGYAPQPGIVPLRPLELGDIFGGAFRYIKDNPAATLGLSFAALLIVEVVQVVLQSLIYGGMSVPRSPSELISVGLTSAGASFLGGLLTLVATVSLSGMLVVVLGRALLGRRTTIGEAWQRIAGRLLGLIGLSLLIALIALVIALVGGGIFALLVVVSGGAGWAVAIGVVVFIAALLFLLYVAVLLSMSTPAYVLEGIGVGAALGRSRALVTGVWWRVFGITLLAGLMVTVISIVVGLVIGGGAAGALATGRFTVGSLIPGAIAGVIVGTFTTPFMGGVSCLLYIDQRIRRERFDLTAAQAAAQGTELL